MRIDPEGGWAGEARKRLAAVKEKLEKRENSLAEPLLAPEEVAKVGTEADLVGDIDGRIEDYLKVAVADWLPKAFPAPGQTESPEALVALSRLSVITQQRHGDRWLADVLSHTTNRRFYAAVKALSISIRANEHGDYVAGRMSAHSAAQLFKTLGNPAGEVRALAEEVYSDHLLWEGEPCNSLLHTLALPLKRNSYTWLQAQMSLEESNCAELVGDLGNYQTAIRRGTLEAEKHSYNALFLRGLGFESQASASLGNADTAFSLAWKGLALFWTGQVDLMKGYNLYTDLDAAADDLRLANLQVVLSRQATALIDRHPDILLRAMAHRWYANAAYLADMPGLAASEFGKASSLFASSPQTAATTRDHMNAEIWLALIEIRQSDLKRAAERLRAIKPDLDSAPNFGNEIGFYAAQADIGMQRADNAATESALRSAIFLAEWALNSFPSENDRHQWAAQTRSTYRDVVEWKLRQGDITSALELWEWYRGSELRANEQHFSLPNATLGIATPPDPHDAPPLPSPVRVANQLPIMHDETAIAYAAFPDGIAVWTYDDRGVLSHWISTPVPQIQNLVVRFQRLCSDPASDLREVRTTARSLYDLLVKPIEERLVQGRTLVFEPDDFLKYVPWEALVDANGHYLAERSATTVTPGLYRTVGLRPASPITSDTPVLIVSVPNVDDGYLAPLSDAQNEAEAVSQEFSDASWLQGADATLSAIRWGIRGKAVFHFAGHAFASGQRGGLVLDEADSKTKQRRLVGARSFEGADITSLRLAVLSACQTGTEFDANLSGTEGLAQFFLNSGVPHVIASRWNVDSSETAIFMKQFYAHLLAGRDVANSLRSARLALVSLPGSAHPYYWSAFELEGTR